MRRIIPKNVAYIYYHRLLFPRFLIHCLLRKRGEAVQFDNNAVGRTIRSLRNKKERKAYLKMSRAASQALPALI